MKRIMGLLGVSVLIGLGMPFANAQSAASATAVAPANPPAVDSTNTLLLPHAQGDCYTNNLGMVLVKVGASWVGKFEVTQKEYQAIMGSNPSQFMGDSRPVDSVSWAGAMVFCGKLTDAEAKGSNALPSGFSYTLPTETEWESLLGDADLKDAVTSLGGRRDGTSAVGSLGPNNLGLYDIRGNVAEFTLGEPDKAYRVLRGGSWEDFIEVNLRPVFRIYAKPDEAKNTYGFRVLLKH